MTQAVRVVYSVRSQTHITSIVFDQMELEGVWKDTDASYFEMLLRRPFERPNYGLG